jgi:hypothetical protein
MGPYLGTPKKEKNSEDGENDKVSYNALHENIAALGSLWDARLEKYNGGHSYRRDRFRGREFLFRCL